MQSNYVFLLLFISKFIVMETTCLAHWSVSKVSNLHKQPFTLVSTLGLGIVPGEQSFFHESEQNYLDQSDHFEKKKNT